MREPLVEAAFSAADRRALEYLCKTLPELIPQQPAAAFAALLFPRLHAVIHGDQKIWELDPEAQVLAPLVVVVALAIFALIGRPLWRGRGSRPATASLVTGILAFVGILAFWISAPIILGGLAATLGYEGLRRGDQAAGRGRAIAGLVLGVLAAAGGATMWLAGV